MTFSPGCAILPMQAGLPRVMAPQGIGMRKVRASQGRITDNVRRGKPPGKCNRNRLPKRRTRTAGARYRWKGEVKAHRHDRQLCANVNPIRCNASARGRGSSAPCLPGRTEEAAERRMATSVTDRWQLRVCVQNPAYKPAERFRDKRSLLFFTLLTLDKLRFVVYNTRRGNGNENKRRKPPCDGTGKC